LAPTHDVNLKRRVPTSLPMRGVGFFPFLSLDSKSKPALINFLKYEYSTCHTVCIKQATKNNSECRCKLDQW
jgi:hypothetical protein